MPLSPFHLAIPVDDLEKAKRFYLDILGCSLGRTASTWIDLDFFGHQLVLHRVVAHNNSASEASPYTNNDSNQVDGKQIPIPHFGVVLDWDAWQSLSKRLKSFNVAFVVEPYVRFSGQIGEQATLFFYDTAGNALEFKAFKDPKQLFAH